MNRKYIFLLTILFVFILHSCDPHRVYEKNIKIPDGVWSHDHIMKFEVMISDTTSLHNIYINVRNASLYPTRNLYLFVTTIAPSGHSVKDTVEIILADEKGKWLGSGLGDIWDLQQIYKKNIRFAQKGKYIFQYQHAMRIKRLPYILDAGLRIEKVKS